MIDWLGLRERSAEGTLTVGETDALVTIARSLLNLRGTLSFCYICGGEQFYDSDTGRMEFLHTDDCAVKALLETSE